MNPLTTVDEFFNLLFIPIDYKARFHHLTQIIGHQAVVITTIQNKLYKSQADAAKSAEEAKSAATAAIETERLAKEAAELAASAAIERVAKERLAKEAKSAAIAAIETERLAKEAKSAEVRAAEQAVRAADLAARAAEQAAEAQRQAIHTEEQRLVAEEKSNLDLIFAYVGKTEPITNEDANTFNTNWKKYFNVKLSASKFKGILPDDVDTNDFNVHPKNLVTKNSIHNLMVQKKETCGWYCVFSTRKTS